MVALSVRSGCCLAMTLKREFRYRKHLIHSAGSGGILLQVVMKIDLLSLKVAIMRLGVNLHRATRTTARAESIVIIKGTERRLGEEMVCVALRVSVTWVSCSLR